MFKKILILCLLFLSAIVSNAGTTDTRTVKVGDEIHVYTTSHAYTQSVLWYWDTSVLELQGTLYGSSTSATFKVISSTPSTGSIIQAITYYYKDGTTSSGINKDVDVWKIFTSGNGGGNSDGDGDTAIGNIRLNKSNLFLECEGYFDLEATIYNASQDSKCYWSSSNGKVAVISTMGHQYARVLAKGPGTTTIRVALSNGSYAECKVEVSPLKFYLNEDENSYSVTSGDYAIPPTLKIPGYYNNLPITRIMFASFWDNKEIINVELPSTLQEIEAISFGGCTNLKNIVLPESLIAIGINAFSHCKSLEKITIPSNVRKIHEGSFQYCERLTNFIIEDSNDAIEFSGYNFYNAPIKELYVGRNIVWTDLSSNSIRFPNSIETLNISGKMTNIEEKMFRWTKSLKTVIITAPIESIGDWAFGECDNLDTLVLPEDVKHLGNFTFYKCKSLKTLKFPKQLNTIGASAFFNTALTEVYLPPLLIEMNSQAFSCCYDLTYLEIPASITNFGTYTFGSCDNIQEILYNTADPLIADVNLFPTNVYKNAKLVLLKGGKEKAVTTTPWNKFTYIEETEQDAGISDANIDSINVPIRIFSLNGTYISNNIADLPSGVYIIVDGFKVKKFIK